MICQKIDTKAPSVQLEWLGNCFLKDLEGNLYFSYIERILSVKIDKKSLEIDNSHWWKFENFIGGDLATLKQLVNCIPKTSGGILGFHCI